MPNVRSMDNLDKAEKLLRQFPNGLSVENFAKKLGVKIRGKPFVRSTGYDYLNSLEIRGLAHYVRGTAYPGKVGEKPSTIHVHGGDYSDKPMLSRQLIPALREIAGITESKYSISGMEEECASPDDTKILVEVAEERLKADPKLCELLENRRKAREEVQRLKKKLTCGLMDKLKQKFCVELFDEPNKESKHERFVGSNLPALVLSHLLYGSPTRLQLDGEKVWFGDSLVAKGGCFVKSIEEFIAHETRDDSNIVAIKQIEENEGKASEAEKKFQSEIRKLIIRIKSEN
jgi:hypothetical protein